VKLGLAVVYHVLPDSEALLQIHLDRFRRHTKVPYVIHGAPLRLPEKFLPQLAAPDLRLHSLKPPLNVLNYVEHSFLLTELLNRAAADGCTHLATLHVDSFPLADHWAEFLAGTLTEQAPVAAVLEEMEGDPMARPNLAGMMMLATYWNSARPFLSPSPELASSPAWRNFISRHNQQVIHSGVGLGYSLEREGRTWTPLRRTNARTRHPALAGVYGDLIFHLGAATRPKSFWSDGFTQRETWSMRTRRQLASTVRRGLPSRIRAWLRPFKPLGNFYDARPQQQNEHAFAALRSELLAAPDEFIEKARRPG